MHPSTRSILMFAVGAILSACSNDPGAGPPPEAPGGLSTGTSSPAPGAAPGPAATTPAPGGASVAPSPATTPAPAGSGTAAQGLPDGFVPAKYCSMKKLSNCSIYGTRYERLEAMTNFCGALGGELTSNCPTADVVGKCLTPADVVNFYYSSGDKPYTKETAEAKCVEKGWIPLP